MAALIFISLVHGGAHFHLSWCGISWRGHCADGNSLIFILLYARGILQMGLLL